MKASKLKELKIEVKVYKEECLRLSKALRTLSSRKKKVEHRRSIDK
jgi:hypothetical protein